MKKFIVALLVLCLLVPNVCYAEEKPDALEFLLALALVGAGTYLIISAIPESKDEDFKYGNAILGGLALYVGTQGLIDFGIRLNKAKREANLGIDGAYLTASIRF